MSKSGFAKLQIRDLDQLWFQVAGTRCNLSCHHCFISCHPKNKNFGFIDLETVKRYLGEARQLGVKEYYFTGGEPFLNPELVPILVAALRQGPATVLTNGMVLNDRWLAELSAASDRSRYSLEFRVSIDGFDPATNDPIRGEGTFRRAIEGVGKLVEFGFLPMITAVQTWNDENTPFILQQFEKVLKEVGYDRPRIKLLPMLKLGEEVERTCGYSPTQRVTLDMMRDFDESQFVCHHSRMVTDRGVHVCPILIESPDSLLAENLSDAMVPFELSHGACFTCYQYGAICSNPSSQRARTVAN